MKQTLERQWLLLRLLPCYPLRKTVKELHAALRERGFATTVRTLQRDLQDLSLLFPVYCDDRDTTYGWSWSQDARVPELPDLDPEAALTLKVLERHAAGLLPPRALAYLAKRFERAGDVLAAAGEEAGLRLWPDRVRVLPRGQALQPPEIAEGITEAVYRALFEGRQFRGVYRPRFGEGRAPEYVVNPLGLVFREPVIYLVATLWDYDDIRQLALHRFDEAVLLESASRAPPEFDLDDYVRQGGFDYTESGTVELVLRIDSGIADHLRETPLSADQRLAPDGAGYRLTATVLDSSQLRWWLRGFGAGVEVVAPRHLREVFEQDAAELAALYGGRPVGAAN